MHRLSVIWVAVFFLISALAKFDITIIARLPLGEILAFASIPFVLNGQKIAPYRNKIAFVTLIMFVWLVGISISDFANKSYFELFLRGAMKPIFCYLWFLFFLGLVLRDYRILMFGALGALVASLQNYIIPQAYTVDYIESGGYEAVAFGLAPILFSLCGIFGLWMYYKHRLNSALAFFLTALGVLLIGGTRNTIALNLLCSFVIIYIWWTRSGNRRSFDLTIPRFILLSFAGILAVSVLFYTYIYLASTGFLGEAQMLKLQDQGNTLLANTPIGVILGGRTAVFGSIFAIRDAPIIGHGSWTAWLMTDYFYEAVAYVGTDSRYLDLINKSGKVAGVGHSIVLQAWLENGILALFAMLGILYIYMKVFLNTISRDSMITPLIVGGTLFFLWAFCFSPFDTNARRSIGLFCALYAVDFPMLIRQLPHPIFRSTRQRL